MFGCVSAVLLGWGVGCFEGARRRRDFFLWPFCVRCRYTPRGHIRRAEARLSWRVRNAAAARVYYCCARSSIGARGWWGAIIQRALFICYSTVVLDPHGRRLALRGRCGNGARRAAARTLARPAKDKRSGGGVRAVSEHPARTAPPATRRAPGTRLLLAADSPCEGAAGTALAAPPPALSPDLRKKIREAAAV